MDIVSFDPLWQSTQASGFVAYMPWTPLSSPQLFSQTIGTNSPIQSLSMTGESLFLQTYPGHTSDMSMFRSRTWSIMSSSLEIRSSASESDYSDGSDTESENVGTLAYTRSDNTWLRDVVETEKVAQTSTQELPQQDGSTEQAVHLKSRRMVSVGTAENRDTDSETAAMVTRLSAVLARSQPTKQNSANITTNKDKAMRRGLLVIQRVPKPYSVHIWLTISIYWLQPIS